MLATSPGSRDTLLFMYTIASADMRYSAVNERAVYLRNDPDRGPILQGEVCDCGPGCHANLSQVLLEFAVSCQGCQDRAKAGELVECTGERLGRILATKLFQGTKHMSVSDRVSSAFQFILLSMGAEFTTEQQAQRIRFDLAGCPLHATAQHTGFVREIAIAHRGFVAICTSMLQNLAPDWILAKPAKRETDDPLLEIVLQYP